MAAEHRPVLAEEALAALAVESGGLYLDCTFGRGGHTVELLRHVGESGMVIGLDRDPAARPAAAALAARDPRFRFHAAPFSRLAEVAGEEGVAGRLAGVLFDLGVSSPQLDAPERGFSFRAAGPLDMRMDPESGESAADWLARASEADMTRAFRELGEERHARRIARAVVRRRAERPLATTGELAELVVSASPTRERHKHPATRVFQAVRMQVNRELEELEAGLAQAHDTLAPGGRLAVITFHSVEDRMVKRFLRDRARPPAPPGLPAAAPTLRLLGKPVRPGDAELRENPRARSALLRSAERLP